MVSPRFHIDQDVNGILRTLLNEHYKDPECAKTAVDLGMHFALDGHHLIVAAQASRVFVTHNAKDFTTMYDAWVRWAAAWGVTPQHAGILIVPQMLAPTTVAKIIPAFMGTRLSLPNEIHAYDSNMQRWVQDPQPRRR